MSTPPATQRAYVGLGSNLEDPAAQVRAALAALDALPGTRLRRASRLYRTPPWGLENQPEFVNAVAELETMLAPRRLFDELQALERGAGRARQVRWGPRVLDLDLLAFGDVRSDDPQLRLPHPHLHERAFVLVPLLELAPALALPGLGTVRELAEKVDCSGIQALG